MKKIIKINIKINIDKYVDLVDGFIVGLEKFSVDFDQSFDINEIREMCNKYACKEIFVSINKNIFNNELTELEKQLLELSKINVKILFYDMSILYINNKNDLNLDLVWNQTHMVTNYNTCNYYYNKGVKYALCSGEITLDEIVEINKNTNMKLLVYVLGHQVMSLSRRKLLTNYYRSIDESFDGMKKEISEHDKKYIVSETNDGTVIKNGSILNGLCIIPELLKENIDYIVIDESYIESEIVIDGLELINDIINNTDVDEKIKQSENIFGNDTSFFFKKTIYKVKGDK